MAQRNIKINVRLTEKEAALLNADVRKTGLSREAYLRALIAKRPVKERPSTEFVEVLRQLRHIGGNMNQIALKANALGLVDATEYRKNAKQLEFLIADLKEAYRN